MSHCPQIALSATRLPITDRQRASIREVLWGLVVDFSWEMHHTDEIGEGTAYAHWVWRALRQRIVVHPSTSNAGRALLEADERRDRLPAPERDEAIAQECQLLVHIMGEDERYWDHPLYLAMRRAERQIIVVTPWGDVHQWTEGALAPLPPT